MMIRMDLAIDRVSLDVEGDDLERIGMHEEGVTLRVINGHSAVRTHRITRILVVLAIVAREFVLIDGVDINHIVECLTEPHLAIVIDAVAHKHPTIVGKYGTVHEASTFKLRVIIALLGIDMVVAGGDVGRADDMGHRVVSVVIECVRREEEVGVLHLHIVVEDRHLRLGVVLAPVGGERGFAVNQLTALEEVGVVVDTVEVETVRIEDGLAMFEYDIVTGTGYLLIAVVVGIVAEE